MNAKQIRDILISYLKTAQEKTRIYQEKSIGGSIFDLMTASDILTGYEIKSDLDNYRRLSGQIAVYDKFFDKNYIVVGTSHAASAKDANLTKLEEKKEEVEKLKMIVQGEVERKR